MLTTEQSAVLEFELRKPDYNGLTCQQAYDFLLPLMPERFRGSAIREAGFKTNLGKMTCPRTGEPRIKSLSMPNAFDPADFEVVFRKVRGVDLNESPKRRRRRRG